MQSLEIKREAARLADDGNAIVISAAFKAASISCPNCEFPQNCAEFRSLLYAYSDSKIQLHRHERLADWSWGHYHSYRACRSRASLDRLEYDTRLTRSMLQDIWPCDDCKTRFNPTGKRKLLSFNAPKGKDFLE